MIGEINLFGVLLPPLAGLDRRRAAHLSGLALGVGQSRCLPLHLAPALFDLALLVALTGLVSYLMNRFF